MLSSEQLKEIVNKTPSKIVFLVMDGAGGLPRPDSRLTELGTANTPNLDELAKKSICGLIDPVGMGITPGSGPGHLGLFGYDPTTTIIGRGVLESLGIGFDLRKGDLAIRGNFCTVDKDGLITDRRAGRIATDRSAPLCEKLDQIETEGVGAFVLPVRDHRFVIVFRGEGLNPNIRDTDPQQVGVSPLPAQPISSEAQQTADMVNSFISRAHEVLANEQPANMILMRGFSELPDLPSMTDLYKLAPAAIATYPMYRGLAKLAGMDILETGKSFEDQLNTLEQHYANYDFFFVHVKATDAAGEDGNFERKTKAIEEVDSLVPRLTALNPNVIVVTGDHSTPALLKGHSWHPVPFMLYSEWCRCDEATQFSETACAKGSLGRFPAVEIMPLALANALKLGKFGA